MTDAGPVGLTNEQAQVLELIYSEFAKSASWPNYEYVQAVLEGTTGLDLDQVKDSLPDGLVVFNQYNPTSSPIQLTIEGFLNTRGDGPRTDVTFFIRALRWLASRQKTFLPTNSTTPEKLRVSRQEVREALTESGVGPGDGHLARILVLLQGDSNIYAGGSGDPNTEWHLVIDRRVRAYRDVESIDDYIAKLHISTVPPRPPRDPAGESIGAPNSEDAPRAPMYVRLLLAAAFAQGDSPIQPIPVHPESDLDSFASEEDIDRGAMIAAFEECERRGWMTLMKVLGPW